jgi:hypothetical protein
LSGFGGHCPESPFPPFPSRFHAAGIGRLLDAGDYRVDAEEHRKLDEMLTEFGDYAGAPRRAEDQDKFDRFMARRNVLRQAR